jgi:hypothetical protein
VSPVEQDELRAQIELLLETGLIRSSVSAWGALVLFTQKKDGGLRMCLDYRTLNKLTVKDKRPNPRVDELFDCIRGVTRFSTIGLRLGYYQIRVREMDVPKTCTCTRYGSYDPVRVHRDAVQTDECSEYVSSFGERHHGGVSRLC